MWYVHNQWYDISCATLYILLLDAVKDRKSNKVEIENM